MAGRSDTSKGVAVAQNTIPDLGRRNLLRGRIGHKALAGIALPWASSEFLEHCNRCLDCLDACPQAIIIKGEGGFPRIDFSRGGCDFCGGCTSVCTTKALDKTQGRPWRHRAHVGGQCLGTQSISCRLCGDACPTKAIRFRLQTAGRTEITLDQAFCTGCGLCLGPCPVGAIELTTSAQEQAA